MADFGEIHDALRAIRKQGNDDIVLLHCNSLYPAPVKIVNLNSIQTMKKEFEIPIGFSDHTMGIHIPVAAVAKGALIIEKHFTLDRKMKGPDHSFAVQPDELKLMVQNIRETEKAMGTGEKKVSEQEKEMYEKGRRSLIAAMKIPKGTKITREMIIIKRPGYGIKPKNLDRVIGKTAKRDISEDQWITWKDI